MDTDNGFLAVRKQLFDFEVAEQEKLGNVLRKCPTASTNLRKSGNKLYASKNHDKRTHENILSLYSESIAFAPVDSEELALAYSNRSALLLHLHHPRKSLIDIAKALEITKSTDLRTKLLSRKANCLKLIEQSTEPEDNTSGRLEIPTFTPSKQLPCAADCVKIDYNKQFGRHMIATRDIEPGEVIIAETACAVFPNGEQLYLNCSHCLSLAWNGIPCDFCAFAIFCTETCKKEAWNAYHDIECCIIPYIFLKQKKKLLMTHVMITARIFIAAVKKEGLENILRIAESIDNPDIHAKSVWTNEEFNCATFKCYYNLSSHDQDIGRRYGHAQYSAADCILSLLNKYTSIFNTFQKIDSSSKDDVKMFLDVKKIMIKLRNIVSINNFGYQIVEDEGSDNDLDYDALSNIWMKGLLLAPCSSFISHSCYPNVDKIFMPKSKIIMMTVLPVKKGEQLYCCYGPSISEEIQERQTFLRDNYYFTCGCEACKNNWTSESLNTLVPIFEVDNFSKCLSDFHKLKSTRLGGRVEDWSIDIETIKDVAGVCKLLSKNLKPHDALLYSYQYAIFLKNAFIQLYQEKRNIPGHC